MNEQRKYEDIARRLREFGYPDATAERVRDVVAGKRQDRVLLGFIKAMLDDYETGGSTDAR